MEFLATRISLKITKITNENPFKKNKILWLHEKFLNTINIFKKILTIFSFSFQSVPITTPESTTDIDNLGIIGKRQNMPYINRLSLH